MSLPRQLLPGQTHFVTRRVTQRQFWLKPSRLTDQIVRFCVARAAERTGVQIHCLTVMSNHWHGIISDPHACLPVFLAWAHEFIAKCVNASYGRWENLWSCEETSVVTLEGEQDVLWAMVYCLCNPVAAGLVERGADWPGVRTGVEQLGGATEEVARPPVFFKEDGGVPETATLRIVRPRAFAELSAADFVDMMRRLVEQREEQHRLQAAASERGFLGAAAVLAQAPHDSPATVEDRRTLNPRLAAKNKWRRIEAIKRVADFVTRHREAFRRWCAGERDVVFPAGTYQMRVVHKVAVADSG